MTGSQKRYLRGRAHALRPTVVVGQRGLTEAVLRQIDGALDSHELIKIRLPEADRDGRAQAAKVLAERLACIVAGSIGHVLILYREHPETPVIQLPATGTSSG